MSKDKSYLSAVVIIPPETVWTQIQDLRRRHDKAFKSWMPHINLLFPFVRDDKSGENFKMAATKLSASLKVQPFTIRFTKDSFQFFEHGRKCNIHLRPLDDTEAILLPVAPPIPVTMAPRPVTSDAWPFRKMAAEPTACPTQTVSVSPPSLPGSADQAKPHKVSIMRVEVSYQVAPTPPVPAQYRHLPAASLSDLHSATWDGYVAPSSGTGGTTGLDALRYAEWKPGDTGSAWVWSPGQRSSVEPYQDRDKRSKVLESEYNDNKQILKVWGSVDNSIADVRKVKSSKKAGGRSGSSETDKKSEQNLNNKQILKVWGSADNPIADVRQAKSSKKSRDRSGSSDTDKKSEQRSIITGEVKDTSESHANVMTHPLQTESNHHEPWSEPSEQWSASPNDASQHEWISIGKNRKKDETEPEKSAPSDSASPAVIELQRQLFQLYPEYGDQNTKSAAGFKPHLTLGQCDSQSVYTTINKWKQDWCDIVFQVKQIYLISREHDGAHEIQQTVQLA